MADGVGAEPDSEEGFQAQVEDVLRREVERLTASLAEWKQIAADLERGSVHVTGEMADDWIRSLRSGHKVIFGHPQAVGLADYIERLAMSASGDPSTPESQTLGPVPEPLGASSPSRMGRSDDKKVRLSAPQYDLLMEMRQSGGLYIDRYKRYGRTAEALATKGLIRDDGEGWRSQPHYVPTEEGWAWTDPTL